MDRFRSSKKLLLLALTLTAPACVTLRPATTAPGQAAVVVDAIEVRQWGDNSCGAGALSAVLGHFGQPVSEEQLNEGLAKGRHGGVVTVDLLLEARRHAVDARLVRGDVLQIEQELREGRPVIVMLRVLDVPGARGDLFHYIVIDGIDAERGLLRMQFGDGKLRWAPVEKIEQAWRGGGYATLLFRRQQAPPDSRELLRRAVALEEEGRIAQAVAIYHELLDDYPHPAVIWTNIGNAEQRRGAVDEAERAYRAALDAQPMHRDALNNLAWLLAESGRDLDHAERLARTASELDGPDRWAILDTLARILALRGKCDEAAHAIASALAASPDEGIRNTIASQPLVCR